MWFTFRIEVDSFQLDPLSLVIGLIRDLLTAVPVHGDHLDFLPEQGYAAPAGGVI